MKKENKRFAIVGTFKECGGTQTIEDYNTAEEALYAFYYIATNGKHLIQNSFEEHLDVSEYSDFAIDVEVWDENNNCRHEKIEKYINYLQ